VHCKALEMGTGTQFLIAHTKMLEFVQVSFIYTGLYYSPNVS